jgi:hypothetical protein
MAGVMDVSTKQCVGKMFVGQMSFDQMRRRRSGYLEMGQASHGYIGNKREAKKRTFFYFFLFNFPTRESKKPLRDNVG